MLAVRAKCEEKDPGRKQEEDGGFGDDPCPEFRIGNPLV